MQPKIRLFLWRAYLDILPTRTKLFDKGVTHSFSCHWCEDEAETASHVLWQCEFVQRVWRACPVPIPDGCVLDMNFPDFISTCILELTHPDLEILFTTTWEIWNARNRLLWDKKHTNVDDIWQRASGLATEFLEAGLNVSEAGGMNVVEVFSHWRPPDARNFKLNLAYCLDSEKTKVGVGVLFRDQMGLVAAGRQQ